jgi:HSP20 family protein
MFVLPLARSAAPRANSPRFSHSLERLLDASFERAATWPTPAPTTRTPALDVSETDTHYTLQLDVPGVTREQLKVTVEGRRVSLETVEAPVASTPDGSPADATPAPAAPAIRELYRERSAARYARTVSLPAEVDQAASQAKFDNGVLTLTLAKKVPTGATQISIS